MESSGYPVLWPFLVYGIAAVGLVVVMLLVSHFLGERHREPETDEVFEAGVKATGSARLRFPIHYYLVAMFFVVFDLEAVFIISWAIAIKQLGWSGYVAILVFTFILIVVLIYEWRTGALDFGPSGKKILRAYKAQKQKTGDHELVDH